VVACLIYYTSCLHIRLPTPGIYTPPTHTFPFATPLPHHLAHISCHTATHATAHSTFHTIPFTFHTHPTSRRHVAILLFITPARFAPTRGTLSWTGMLRGVRVVVANGRQVGTAGAPPHPSPTTRHLPRFRRADMQLGLQRLPSTAVPVGLRQHSAPRLGWLHRTVALIYLHSRITFTRSSAFSVRLLATPACRHLRYLPAEPHDSPGSGGREGDPFSNTVPLCCMPAPIKTILGHGMGRRERRQHYEQRPVPGRRMLLPGA